MTFGRASPGLCTGSRRTDAASIERHRRAWSARFDALEDSSDTCNARRRQMPQAQEGSRAATHGTDVEPRGDRELVVTRSFNAPARIVFEAWSNPDLFQRWWVFKAAGISLLSCDMDVRTGGAYRLVFGHPVSGQPMVFLGTYLEVAPNERIVWTNEESDQGAVTTATFEEDAGKTLVTLHERYPTQAARDEALAGSAEALPVQFSQLAGLLAGRS